MWKLLIMLLLPSIPISAQTYHNITHLEGNRKINGIGVTVKQIGKPKTGGGTCGINDYWIGYSANNGYEFSFEKPLSKLRVRLTAINRDEIISFKINDELYLIPENNVHPYDGECIGVAKATIEDGRITCKEYIANAEIDIAPNFPISSITIYHTNGKKKGAGTVFDIAMIADAPLNGAGNGTTGIDNIALQTGMFYMLPNPASKLVRLAFLPMSTGTATITVTDMAGRKVLLQAFDCNKGSASQLQLDVERFTPGNYMVELNLNEEHYVEKLVKL
jgi:hypothetical protein